MFVIHFHVRQSFIHAKVYCVMQFIMYNGVTETNYFIISLQISKYTYT